MDSNQRSTNRQDWMLMQRVSSGDEQAVEELYDRFGALVFRVARQFLSSRAEAEDAAQEIFVRLWRTSDRFDPHRARLVTWVMLIARRYLIDRLRRSSVRPDSTASEVSELTPGAADSVGDAQDEERNSALRKKVAQLPELQREVIERAYLQGFTLREVSEQLDSPLGTVKSALSRGLARLRESTKSDLAG